MSGGCLSMAARSAAAVSPVRTATLMAGAVSPSRPAAAAISRSGASRFCWMSVASAFSGDTYTTCGPDPAGVAPSSGAPSGAHPPAARVRSTDRARSTDPGRGRTGRCRPGTPPASCRTRWAPRSACGGPRRSPATPRPAARSARPESGLRTRHARRDGTTRAPAHATSGLRHSSRRVHHALATAASPRPRAAAPRARTRSSCARRCALLCLKSYLVGERRHWQHQRRTRS